MDELVQIVDRWRKSLTKEQKEDVSKKLRESATWIQKHLEVGTEVELHDGRTGTVAGSVRMSLEVPVLVDGEKSPRLIHLADMRLRGGDIDGSGT